MKIITLNILLSAILPRLVASTQYPILSSHSSSQSDVISLHESLVSISSITLSEHEVASWLTEYLEAHNFTVDVQKVDKSRSNLIAYPSTSSSTSSHSKSNTSILLTSHIDTVPPFLPYARNSSGFISGRGSVDAKACVAAQIIAVRRYLDDHPSLASTSPAPLSLLFVVGEETGGDGMIHFAAHSPPQYSAVIFGEPTEAKLASAHKGMLGFSVHVTGRAAHSGYPWLGLSANALLLQALDALLVLEKQLPASKTLGPSTLNIGRINGGEAANVVAAHAQADIAVRLAGGTPEAAKQQVLDALETVKKAAENGGGEFYVEWKSEAYSPVTIDTDIPGFEVAGMNYGTDIPHFPGNHKTYLWGPGSILVAHGPNEGLWDYELESAVDAYQKMIGYLLEH
jgi:acetylornithine deacetylase